RLPAGRWYAALGASAGALVVLGALTFEQTRIWKDSRTLWEYVLRIDPTNYVAYTNRGYLRTVAGDAQGGLADYDTALAIHPGSAPAYYDRGTARLQAGALAAALGDLSRSIELNPGDPRAWNNRGWVRERTGDLGGAAADYAEALRRAPAEYPGREMMVENLAFLAALGVVPPSP